MKPDSVLSVTLGSTELPGVICLIRSHFGTVSSSTADDPIRHAFEHHFQVPGKQMRASLSLNASKALGIDEATAKCLAACVETLHNASLILDDFQDAALERREHPTVCAMFGRDVALGLTLRLTTTAFVNLSQIKISKHLAALTAEVHQAVADTILGQTWDQDADKNSEVEEVKQTAALKSGPLFGLSLSLPLIAAGHLDSVPTARRLGKLFGLGYQALDDLKDRATDRLQAADANIVNAFESDLSFVEAEMATRKVANTVLSEAQVLADQLPHQSGTGIGRLIAKFSGLST
ncbi:MAG: (2E,6E)-farnesyl diphosphate synthase [Opitutia bacterium UBA7350]|nr:MAG: (2E,6E)-farnesyl diphosphate synthase [Opitutae bacterium UBA7350]